MKLYVIKPFIFICLCFISYNCIAVETWRNVIGNNLVKYFKYDRSKDKIYRSGDVFISAFQDVNIFIPVIHVENNIFIPINLHFNLNSVNSVLLIMAGCRSDPGFLAFFKLDPTKKVQSISTRFKVSCFRKAFTVFLFVRTQDNKIYSASQFFVSRYKETEAQQEDHMKDIIPGQELSVALHPLSIKVNQKLEKLLSYKGSKINEIPFKSSGPCEAYKELKKVKQYYSQFSYWSNSYCKWFDLKAVSEVLVLQPDCQQKQIYQAYYKLDPNKNVQYAPTEKKFHCSSETYLYLKTADGKFYSSWSGYVGD